MHNISQNDSMHQLDEMKDPLFNPIRQTDDFIAIEKELKKHAKRR